MTTEQRIIIDNKEYNHADLPEAAHIQLNNIQVTDAEIARQESLLAMLKTARSTYARLLAEAISSPATTDKAKPATNGKAKPATAAKRTNRKAPAKA